MGGWRKHLLAHLGPESLLSHLTLSPLGLMSSCQGPFLRRALKSLMRNPGLQTGQGGHHHGLAGVPWAPEPGGEPGLGTLPAHVPGAGWHWVPWIRPAASVAAPPASDFGLRGTPGQGLGGEGIELWARISSSPRVLAVRAPQGLGAEAGVMASSSTGDLKAQGREQWLAGHLPSRREVWPPPARSGLP